MNCVKQQTIKIVEGNAFTLIFPLKRRTYVSNVPIDEDIVIADLTDVVVKFGGVEYASVADPRGLMVALPATLAKATYNATITAKYHGAEIQAAYYECVTIVAWNFQSDAQEYIQGSPIAVAPAYVIGGPMTDAELEELKAQLREEIAAAEEAEAEAQAAKEEWERRIEELDDVAKESTSQEIKNQIGDLGDVIEAINGDSIDGILDVYLDDYAEKLQQIIGI